MRAIQVSPKQHRGSRLGLLRSRLSFPITLVFFINVLMAENEKSHPCGSVGAIWDVSPAAPGRPLTLLKNGRPQQVSGCRGDRDHLLFTFETEYPAKG